MKQVNKITSHEFKDGKLKLSTHDKQNLQYSTIVETALTKFIDEMEESEKHKKDDFTKSEFKKVIRQSKMMLGQFQKVNETLLNCLTQKDVKLVVLKSYELLKILDGKK